jgi:hypothetical protein
MVCHSRAAVYVLGLTTAQMNRVHDYGGVSMNQLTALEKLGVFRVPKKEHLEVLTQRGAMARDLLSAALRFGVLSPLRKCCLDPLEKQVQKKLEAKGRAMRKGVERKGGDTTLLPKDPDEYPRLADPYDDKADLDARVRSYLQSNCAHCHVWAGGGNSAIDLHVNTPLDKMRLVREEPLHDRFGVRDALLVAPGAPERSILYHRVSRRGAGQMPPLASGLVDEKAKRLLAEWIRRLK